MKAEHIFNGAEKAWAWAKWEGGRFGAHTTLGDTRIDVSAIDDGVRLVARFEVPCVEPICVEAINVREVLTLFVQTLRRLETQTNKLLGLVDSIYTRF